MTNCPRCGKTALQPDAVHTCSPKALVLADKLQQQAVWEGHYGPSYLRDLLPEAAAELRRLHAENEAKDALLQQALEALELYVIETDSEFQRKAITALRARLNHTEKS